MRLIDADALKAKATAPDTNSFTVFITEVLNGLINKAPTVDAVPVVRCKDCKYSYESLNNRICSHGVCVDCVVTNDFYCGCGAKMYEEG